MDYSRCCIFCKKNGPFLQNRVMLIHRLKLMFATDTFDALLLKKNTCLICTGRILQVFDFYMVKSNVDKLDIKTSENIKCTFCHSGNLMNETDVAIIQKLALQAKLISVTEESSNDSIFCCYGCYNFLHEYINIQESLVQEIEVFKHQFKDNDNNFDKPGFSRKNTEISRKSINLSKRSRLFSKNNSTETNEATQHTVEKKGRYSNETFQFHSLPMTRLPFKIPTTTDELTVVKIEQPVLDTANISECNLSSQPLLSVKVGELSIVPQINQTTNSINSLTVTKDHQFSEELVPSIENTLQVISATEELNCIAPNNIIPVLMENKKQQNVKHVLRKKSIMEIKTSEQNESKDCKLKSQIMVAEPTVIIEHDITQQQPGETNQNKVKEAKFQNESDKNKLNIEPLVNNLKQIQKNPKPKKSYTRSKKIKSIQIHKNVLNKENKGKPKMQKTVEELRLEYNLLKDEKVVLERCDLLVPVAAVNKRIVRKEKYRRRRRYIRKNTMKIETQAVERCKNVQKMFNDGDFNLPDPTEITEHFLNYSHHSKKEEIKNLRSNKNGSFDDNEYNVLEYLDNELAITQIEFLEPRKDGYQYFEMPSDRSIC